MAIDRMPWLLSQDVADYVDRLLDREADDGSWRQRVILAADTGDSGGNFAADSRRLEMILPTELDAQRIHLDEMNLLTAHQELFSVLAMVASIAWRTKACCAV